MLDWIKSNIELSLADERFSDALEQFLQSHIGERNDVDV